MTFISRDFGEWFSAEGITVTHSADGVDGLHEAITEEYDVIILRYHVAQERRIRSVGRTQRQGYATPVIILSAKHSVEERVQGLQSGADDYLVKLRIP